MTPPKRYSWVNPNAFGWLQLADPSLPASAEAGVLEGVHDAVEHEHVRRGPLPPWRGEHADAITKALRLGLSCEAISMKFEVDFSPSDERFLRFVNRMPESAAAQTISRLKSQRAALQEQVAELRRARGPVA